MADKLSELHKDLMDSGLRFRGLNILSLSQVLVFDSYLGAHKSCNVVNIAKKLGIENLMKSFLFKTSNLFLNKRNSFRCDYLFINEVNNEPVIQALNLVYKEFVDDNAAIVYSDIRLGKPSNNTINIFEYATLGRLFKSIYEFAKILPSLYKSHEITFISRKYQIQRGIILRNIFDSIFLINIVENLFAKAQFGKIILMSDVHKLSRIVTLIAKTFKINTFVIQHGATVGEAGYLPILADKIMVWGESSKNWFVDREQSVNKIQVVGSPRMDSFNYKELRNSQSNHQSWRYALVVMSEVSIERPFLETIKEALLKYGRKNIHIIIKLHPGGAIDYSYMPKEIFGQSGLPYEILRHGKINILLTEADIVFVTTSSVGMEAIVHNKPIFLYKSPDLFNPKMSYEAFDCSHIFETSEQLLKLISDPVIVNSKLSNYPRFVNYYFGELDGSSSARIKHYVKSYSPN
jgi:hypothetical protein